MTAAVASQRPVRPSHAKRNAGLIDAAAVVVWAVLTVEADWTELAEVPGGIARLFYRLFLENGVDWTYLPSASEAMAFSHRQSSRSGAVGSIVAV